MVDPTLGREPHRALEEYQPAGELGKVLITGNKGSVGQALQKRISGGVIGLDLPDGDVTDWDGMFNTLYDTDQITTVFHLAGAKHAPQGEESPWIYATTNIEGTGNILELAKGFTIPRVVVASTCKACDPETVYGATKLVAERMTLEAGHSVARFHNVVRSSGNVFETWDEQPVPDPIQVTDCFRRFITMSEAVGLLLYAADPKNQAGRYIVDPTVEMSMPVIAREVYPDREIVDMARRRGDRWVEPRIASCESTKPATDGVARVSSPHDPA